MSRAIERMNNSAGVPSGYVKPVEEMDKRIDEFLSQSADVAELRTDVDGAMADFADHKNGTAFRHRADDVDYDNGLTVGDRIRQLARGDGVTYHSELLGRDAENSHPISAIKDMGELLVFKGTTTLNDRSIALSCDQSSMFLNEYDGVKLLLPPRGYLCEIELTAFCAEYALLDDEGEVIDGYILSTSPVCRWSYNGYAIRSSESSIPTLHPTDSIDYDYVGSDNPNCDLDFNYITGHTDEGLFIKATQPTTYSGALTWKAFLRIKNIMTWRDAI